MKTLDTKARFSLSFLSLCLLLTAPLAVAKKSIDTISDVGFESTYNSGSDGCTLDLSGHVVFNTGHARQLTINVYDKTDYETNDTPTSQDSRSLALEGNTDVQLAFPGLSGGRFGQEMVIVWSLNKKKVVTAMAVGTTHQCGLIIVSPPEPCIGCGGEELPVICIGCETTEPCIGCTTSAS